MEPSGSISVSVGQYAPGAKGSFLSRFGLKTGKDFDHLWP